MLPCLKLALFFVCIIAHAYKIPIIDLSQSDEQCASQLFQAAVKYGFFSVINHGMRSEAIQETLLRSQQFFNLDLNEKVQISQNLTHWGYIAYKTEITDASKQSEGDTKEGFRIHHRMNHSSTNIKHRQNQWPSSSLLPDWKDVILKYMNGTRLLANRLTKIIAASLNLSSTYFEQRGIRDDAVDILYLLHYRKQVSSVQDGVFGSGPHTDYDLFTILLTDGNPGLQIMFENEWIHVEYKANALIVNIADTLRKWTNDIFTSAMHRVVLDGKHDRYAIPYFVAANYDTLIDCLPNTVITGDDKYATCNHVPFKSGEYLDYRLQATYDTHKEL